MAQTESKPEASTFAHDLRNIVDDADQLLKHAVKSGDAQFDEMRDKFEAQLRRMRMQLDEFENTAIHRAREAARVTDETVRAHPYASIGVGAAMGLLVGFLLARR